MLRFGSRLTSRFLSVANRRHFAVEATAEELPKAVDTAGRYAAALYNAARKMDSLDAVISDVDRMLDMQKKTPALAEFLRNPSLSRSAKSETLNDVIKGSDFNPTFSQFVMVMAENGRTGVMPKALQSFQDIISSMKGEVVCKVTTTEPLNEWELALLRKRVKQRFFADKPDAEITMETAIDEELLGGLTIQVGDRFMDLSTRTELRKLQEAISQAGS